MLVENRIQIINLTPSPLLSKEKGRGEVPLYLVRDATNL